MSPIPRTWWTVAMFLWLTVGCDSPTSQNSGCKIPFSGNTLYNPPWPPITVGQPDTSVLIDVVGRWPVNVYRQSLCTGAGATVDSLVGGGMLHVYEQGAPWTTNDGLGWRTSFSSIMSLDEIGGSIYAEGITTGNPTAGWQVRGTATYIEGASDPDFLKQVWFSFRLSGDKRNPTTHMGTFSWPASYRPTCGAANIRENHLIVESRIN